MTQKTDFPLFYRGILFFTQKNKHPTVTVAGQTAPAGLRNLRSHAVHRTALRHDAGSPVLLRERQEK